MSQPDEENQLSEISTTEPQATSESPATNEKQAPRLYGYLAIAELMANIPAMGMYRRFGMLNALSLLFYQADLLKLETELKQQIRQDELSGNNDRRKVCRDWSAASATDSQRKLIEQARLLLEKYSECLQNSVTFHGNLSQTKLYCFSTNSSSSRNRETARSTISVIG